MTKTTVTKEVEVKKAALLGGRSNKKRDTRRETHFPALGEFEKDKKRIAKSHRSISEIKFFYEFFD